MLTINVFIRIYIECNVACHGWGGGHCKSPSVGSCCPYFDANGTCTKECPNSWTGEKCTSKSNSNTTDDLIILQTVHWLVVMEEYLTVIVLLVSVNLDPLVPVSVEMKTHVKIMEPV